MTPDLVQELVTAGLCARVLADDGDSVPAYLFALDLCGARQIDLNPELVPVR